MLRMVSVYAYGSVIIYYPTFPANPNFRDHNCTSGFKGGSLSGTFSTVKLNKII